MSVPVTPRADGATPSERYLQKLCEKSFLKLWAYAGVYRDQGKRSDGHGKEVCDLIVVFDRHVVLFSDKYCAFPDTGNIDVDWNRWRRKAIDKSVEQIRGAERWITTHPDRCFLDRACTVPFPLTLPSDAAIKVHRVVVARGAGTRCSSHYGGSGSLMLWSSDAEAGHSKAGKKLPPFSTTPLGGRSKVVHVLDDYSLDVVLRTLDTITDFVHYLDKKEAFVTSSAFQSAAGEEELLALYLQSWNQNAEQDFFVPDVHSVDSFDNRPSIVLAEGGWKELADSVDWQAWQAYHKPSYLWDEIIASFADHAFSGTLYRPTDASLSFNEKLLRTMAAESRARRRFLSISLLQHLQRVSDKPQGVRLVRPANLVDEPVYIFLSLRPDAGESHDEYRNRRRETLSQYAWAAKYRVRDANTFVAIGVEPLHNPGHSHDIVMLDAANWGAEEAAIAEALVEGDGLLKEMDPSQKLATEKDFVHARLSLQIAARIRQARPGRNDPCPCGSGAKFKKCHGSSESGN